MELDWWEIMALFIAFAGSNSIGYSQGWHAGVEAGREEANARWEKFRG